MDVRRDVGAWRALRRALRGEAVACSAERLAAAARVGQVVVLAADRIPGLDAPLREDVARALFVHMHVEQAARRVADVLEGVCPAVLLKGNATAHLVYDRPEHRQTVDVDVLVPAGGFAAALEALRGDGWRDAVGPGFAAVEGDDPYEWALARTFGRVRVACDLHQRFTWGRRFHVDHEAVLARAVEVPRALLPVCHPEDALIHAAVHAAASALRVPLKSWIDVDRLVRDPGVDLRRVAERARRWRCATALWAALGVASRWLGTPVPGEVRASLRPGQVRARALEVVLSGDAAAPTFRDLSPRVGHVLLGPLVGDDLGASAAWAKETAHQVVRARLPR
ncbi:MAG: nucleotidyltransferase family protein [Myxococcota bacterium]